MLFNNGDPRAPVTPLSTATPRISSRGLEYNFPHRFHKVFQDFLNTDFTRFLANAFTRLLRNPDIPFENSGTAIM